MTALRIIAVVALTVAVLSTLSCSVSAFSMNLTNYKLTFEQDFTTMKTLNVSDWGPNGPGGSVWIAHKPDGEDWCDFYNPTAPYLPFNIGDGKLTIRASVTNITGKPQYYAGMLSTNDPKGNGFSQRYGYFEMKAKLPLGLGGWPAFWLMDSDGMRNRTLGTYHEIDILEEYGDNPAILHATLHLWDTDSSKDWGYGYTSLQCSMTTGYHTYGLDLQPDWLTFYYDRQMIVRAPNYIPATNSTYDREMFVMVNMAYGGGSNLNNETNLNRGPLDMLVEYVRVWQGTGGSVPSNSTLDAIQLSWATAQLTVSSGQSVDIQGVSLMLLTSGNMIIKTTEGTIVWQTNTTATCLTATCAFRFQNDGNIVMSDDNGKPYWSSRTWNDNMGSLTFLNTDPYLQVFDGQCNILWTTHNQTSSVDVKPEKQPKQRRHNSRISLF